MGKAKRPALKSLPTDWREQMWGLATSPEWQKMRPRLLPPLALLWVTGCRPAEIHDGVILLVRESTLVIYVRGAKCNDVAEQSRGQPMRRYVFEISRDVGPALIYLHSIVTQAMTEGRKGLKIQHKKEYLYNCVVELAKATFPRMRTRVSPYCFRHQTGSDLKADPSISLEKAAQWMGHVSDFSISKYGRAARGRSGNGNFTAVLVETERAVRHSPKVDRLARFKLASAKKQRLKIGM